MIQKNTFSSTNSLFRGQNERFAAYKLSTPHTIENKENHWKRKVDVVQATATNPCAWKRQRCSYNGEATTNRIEVAKSKVGTMTDNTSRNELSPGCCTNGGVNKKRRLPSDGVSFMMPLDIPLSTSGSDAMALDDAFDFINPEDYYEDKWH